MRAKDAEFFPKYSLDSIKTLAVHVCVKQIDSLRGAVSFIGKRNSGML